MTIREFARDISVFGIPNRTFSKAYTKTLKVVLPEMFGAVGDGVTDDTAAFSSAIALGRPVLLTAPSYALTTVSLSNGVYITSEVGSQIRPLIDTLGVFILNGCDDVGFDGIHFTDPERVLQRDRGFIRADTSCSNYRIERCHFYDMEAHGIRFLNTENGYIARNKCYNNTTTGMLSDETSNEFRFNNNQTNLTIEYNDFVGQDNILTSKESAILVHAVTPGTRWENVHILHNTTRRYRRFGIGTGSESQVNDAAACRDVWIMGNAVYDSGMEGIKTKGGVGQRIENNLVDGFELVMQEKTDDLIGGIFMQITPESSCSGNRIYGRDRKLFEGLAGTATTTTVTLPANDWQALESAASGTAGVNVMTGKRIEIVSGTGSGQFRYITGYVNATNIATVSPAWTSQPDETSMLEVWSNPSVGIQLMGRPDGATTWDDPEDGRAFECRGNYIEGCDTGVALNECLVLSHVVDTIVYNCASGLRCYTAGLAAKNSRSLTVRNFKFRYVDYPNTSSRAAFTLRYLSEVLMEDVSIHGATNYGFQTVSVSQLKWIGGLIENSGQSGNNAYGMNLDVTTNSEFIGVTSGGGKNTTQQRGILFIGSSNAGLSFIGCDFTGNTVEAINATFTPPTDTRFIGCKGVGVQPGITTLTNAAKTLVVGVDKQTCILSAAITADRAITLQTTKATIGDEWEIVRTAAATGAFNLNVGVGPLVALAPSQWCRVRYDGTAWRLVAYGLTP